jgi:hypothetical protein
MRLLGLSLLALAVGCSPPKPSTDSGVGCIEAGACADKNPAGDCYPVGPYGSTQRAGSIAGDRIQNFVFQGYLNLDPKTKTAIGPLQQIKLSDFYDPMAKKYRVIRLITSAGWCGPCIMETQFLSMAGGAAETLTAQGVVFVSALMEGTTQGMGAGKPELDDWITKWAPNFTQVLDPSAANLGLFSPASAVPFSITIDARSMEILGRDKGFTDGSKLQADVQTWVTWTMSNPPLKQACP